MWLQTFNCSKPKQLGITEGKFLSLAQESKFQCHKLPLPKQPGYKFQHVCKQLVKKDPRTKKTLLEIMDQEFLVFCFFPKRTPLKHYEELSNLQEIGHIYEQTVHSNRKSSLQLMKTGKTPWACVEPHKSTGALARGHLLA